MSGVTGASVKDLARRLSRSSFRGEDSTRSSVVSYAYDGLDSPKALPKSETVGVTSAVGLSVWDRRWLGLVAHSVAIGIVSTALPLAVYPFMTCNLNMEGTQTLSVRMLLVLPWVLKPLFMVAIDGLPFPAGFQRRRSSLALGWVISAAALIRIFFIDQPSPFFGDRELVGSPLIDLTDAQLATINPDAPGKGSLYALFMVIATVGYVLADVAADALTREIASRHLHSTDSSPIQAENGLLTQMLTKWRTLAMLATFPFMGVAMSGWDYGGDFDFTLEFTDVMLIVGIVVALPVPLALIAIDEVPSETQSSFSKPSRSLWTSLRNHSVNNVMVLRFISGVFNGFSSVAVNPIAFYFAGVQPLNDNVVSFVAVGAVLLAINHIDKRGWNVDYRVVMVVATGTVLVLDCGATMFAVWNLVRTQWLWIGLPVMEAIPSVLDYIIFTDLLSELAEPGAELLMGAFVTATSFAANALGLAIAKYIGAQFDVSNQDIMGDSGSTRSQITAVFLIAYAAQAASIACVVALPRHASDARLQKASSESSTVRAAALAVVLALTFTFSTVMHALSVNESTSCLAVAAGSDC